MSVFLRAMFINSGCSYWSFDAGDNAYEIIGPDDESPQGANDISVAEVSPIPP